MKKLLALVKINLQVQRNIFFDAEDKKIKKKILSLIAMGIFILFAMELYAIKAGDVVQLYGLNKSYIFFLIIIIETVLIALVCISRVINLLYLTSDWKEISIYPLKKGVVLLSRLILVSYQNFFISLIFFIPLVTYGSLVDSINVLYILKLIFYQICAVVIPPLYIMLISLAVAGIIGQVKKIKIKKVNILSIILIDFFIIALTYIAIKNISNNKFIFILIFIIMLSVSTLYFVGSSIYIDVMKNGVFNSSSSNRKIINNDTDEYEFRQIGEVKANFIRDFKLIFRIPALKTNCMIGNMVFDVITLIICILARNVLIRFFQGSGVIVSAAIFSVYTWVLSIINPTAATSFSREGSGIRMIRVFPMKIDNYILSKFYVALVSYVFVFIWGSFIAYISSDTLFQLFLFEVMLISTIVLMTIVNMKADSENVNLSWVDIKELFELERALKLTKFVNISILLYAVYSVIFYFILKFYPSHVIECIGVMIIILVNIILSLSNWKKIKLNMEV